MVKCRYDQEIESCGCARRCDKYIKMTFDITAYISFFVAYVTFYNRFD